MKIKCSSIKFKFISALLIILLIIISSLSFLSIKTTQKSIKQQLEQDGTQLVKEIILQIENNNETINSIDKLLEDNMISICNIIAKGKLISNDYLFELAKSSNISEINLANQDGVIIYSNLNENLGFIYQNDHAVSKLIHGKDEQIVEDIRKSSVSNDYYKYSAIKLKDGTILQIGILANSIEDIKSSVSNQNIIEKIVKQEGIEYITIIDKNLTAIAHSDKEKIGKTFNDKGSKEAAKNGNKYAWEYEYKPGLWVYDVLVPLYNNGEHIGAVDVGISMKNLENVKKQMFINTIIVAFIAFALSSGIIILLLDKLLRPLNEVIRVSNEVSDGDLTKVINIKDNNEIGMLASSFNKMTNNLRSMTTKIKETTSGINDFSQELLSSTEQAAIVSEQIAISTQNIAIGSEKQSQSTENVLNNIKEVATGMDNIKHEVKDVVDNADNTSELAIQGREKMVDMVNQMNTIKENVGYTYNVMNDLEKASREIEDILQVINNIADQTNLLALNAAIEAARAGESGKGFAVVSDEIRKLADESTKSAGKIQTLILSNQKNTKRAMNVINQGLEETNKGEVIVTQVGEYLKDILNGFEVTKQKLYRTNESINLSNEKVKNIENVIYEIEAIAMDSVASTEEVAASSEQQSVSIQEISSSVQELSCMTRELEFMVEQFKV
ncbi:methyl-accepting chemotaxis protein [Tepidibacter aestuarii]|uniref:methyl-accepting chemotaxis protein n=1 Tax=Tepidibacter aestuarii TaxID=2925782 RepID=UPI0020BF0D79|nr:methyl-accepting chemotaxis protein [Tepidibacter aestuarii]